jgi:murein DD-endopeptidase MepM/ murein hydrolase activator NlpD
MRAPTPLPTDTETRRSGLGRLPWLAALMATMLIPLASASSAGAQAPAEAPLRLANGLVLPYPLDNLFRGWTECVGRGQHHKALDIGGVGPDAGLGTPIFAMGPGRVLSIGLPSEEPERFGEPLTDTPTTVRSRRELPTHAEIPPYGTVHFFTKDYGRHRSGAVIAIRIDGGPLDRHTLRYMHLAAVHPALEVGGRVEAGQEIGLMGGTAVQEDSPHLHLAIESPSGRYLDVGRILGIGSTRAGCRAGKAGRAAVRARYQKQAKRLMRELREASARTASLPAPLPRCGMATVEGDFSGGSVDRVQGRWPAPVGDFDAPWELTLEPLESAWRPRLRLLDALGTPLFDGRRKTAFAPRRARLELAWRRRPTRHVALNVKKLPPGDLVIEVDRGDLGRRAHPVARWRLTASRPCPEVP